MQVLEAREQQAHIASRNSQIGHQENLFKGNYVKHWNILATLLKSELLKTSQNIHQ